MAIQESNGGSFILDFRKVTPGTVNGGRSEGMVWTPQHSYGMTSVRLSMAKNASLSGTVWVELWDVTTQNGDLPNELLNISGVVNVASVPQENGSPSWIDFPFGVSIPIVAGVKRAIILRSDIVIDGDGWIKLEADSSLGFAPGIRIFGVNNDTDWQDEASVADMKFETLGTAVTTTSTTTTSSTSSLSTTSSTRSTVSTASTTSTTETSLSTTSTTEIPASKRELIKLIKWYLKRFKITRETLEKAMDWEEDTIHGVPLASFDSETLGRMWHKLQEVILRDRKIRVDPGRIFRLRI